jgi:hypothetical protein
MCSLIFDSRFSVFVFCIHFSFLFFTVFMFDFRCHLLCLIFRLSSPVVSRGSFAIFFPFSSFSAIGIYLAKLLNGKNMAKEPRETTGDDKRKIKHKR